MCDRRSPRFHRQFLGVSECTTLSHRVIWSSIVVQGLKQHMGGASGDRQCDTNICKSNIHQSRQHTTAIHRRLHPVGQEHLPSAFVLILWISNLQQLRFLLLLAHLETSLRSAQAQCLQSVRHVCQSILWCSDFSVVHCRLDPSGG